MIHDIYFRQGTRPLTEESLIVEIKGTEYKFI